MAIIQNLFIYRSKVEPENKSFIWARTVQVREKIEIELLIWDVDHWITLGDSSIIEEFRNYPWDTLTPDVPTPIEDGTDIFTAITSLHSLVKENVKNILTLENKQISIDADIVMLNSRVDDVSNTILDVKDDITTINNNLSVIGTDITNVNDRVNDTNTRIDNTNIRIDETNNDIQDLDDKVVGLYDSVRGDITQLSNTKLDKAPDGNIQLIRDDSGLIDNAYLPASQIPVTGVKGNEEFTYRTGNVNLNLTNILGDLRANEVEKISEELATITNPDNVEYLTSYRKNVGGNIYLNQYPYSYFALKSDLKREFTFIVDSQDKCVQWQDPDSHGIDVSRVLVIPGRYTLGSQGIPLYRSKYVKAMPGAVFVQQGYSSTGTFFGDSDTIDMWSVPPDILYEGLVVELGDMTTQYTSAFRYCYNLKNCGVILIPYLNSTGATSLMSFDYCFNLYGCYSNLKQVSFNVNANIINFSRCANLNDCMVDGYNGFTTNQMGTFNAYDNCYILNNCHATFAGSIKLGGIAHLFFRSDDLISCVAEIPSVQDVGSLDMFTNCNRLSRCKALHRSQVANYLYSGCRSMQNNYAYTPAPSNYKYTGCYADAGTVYPVSDTPNGGFNS